MRVSARGIPVGESARRVPLPRMDHPPRFTMKRVSSSLMHFRKRSRPSSRVPSGLCHLSIVDKAK